MVPFKTRDRILRVTNSNLPLSEYKRGLSYTNITK